ncbi:MAG: DNA-processing protein DprA [Lachnospiraceae bacterium]|nr:DNA-processing protein DprA [Lachnospiraceae bacterium]
MDLYFVWLSLLKGIGPKNARLLMQKYGSVINIYESWDKICERANYDWVDSREESKKAMEKAERILSVCYDKKIDLISYENPIYNNEWKRLNDFPILFYAKGDLKNLAMPGVGIVGARRCSTYGKEEALRISNEVVQLGKAVVSGMAKGIDSYAHTSALKNDGHTVAVLGSGVDICYPAEHKNLYYAICEKGVVLSEYPPETPPKKYNFPMRNRIIAGLSDILYVIEAGERSGTTSTVRAAKRYGREVFIK